MTTEQQHPIAHMRWALLGEIAEIRQLGNTAQIEIADGVRLRADGATVLYQFLVATNMQLRDDSSARVVYRGQEVECTIVSLRGGVLLLALAEDIGPVIGEARLLADDTFLLQRLCGRLDTILTGDPSFNSRIADTMLGLHLPRSGKAEPDPAVFADGTLNDEQQAAVRLGLGSEVAFIWGPPGTGKTSTLARVVEAHYRAGRSVLIVSNTNIAVDTALEYVAERLEMERAFARGHVLRFGRAVKESLIARFGDRVLLDRVAARREPGIAAAFQLLEAEVGRLSAKRIRLTRAGDDTRQVPRLHEAVRSRERSLADQVLHACTLPLAQRAPEDAICRQMDDDLASVRRALVECASRIAGWAGLGAIEAELTGVEGELKRLDAQRRKLDQSLDVQRDACMADCRILATTVYHTFLPNQVRRQFDVVVIDEASMLMLPMAYYAAGLASKAVIVAGDFRQLPAIVLSHGEAADHWLRRDIFASAGINTATPQAVPPAHLATLRKQYRMAPAICTLVNSLAYSDAPLRTAPPVLRRPSSRLLFSDADLIVVDTSSLGGWAARRLGSYSRYNLLHATLARNLVIALRRSGLASGADPEGLGVVAPYSAQARAIQSLVRDELDIGSANFISTVHRFQGNEKGAMIVDLPDAPGVQLGSFMKAKEFADEGTRLLNVAVSRAKGQVVVLANLSYLRTEAPPGASVRRLLSHMEGRGTLIDARTLLQDAGNWWLDGRAPRPEVVSTAAAGLSGVFASSAANTMFAADATLSHRSIVVFSPTLTTTGVEAWSTILEGSLRRGSAVRVVTRPPSEQPYAARAVQLLKALNITVDYRADMATNLAIVDGSTLWHGTLQLLGERRTDDYLIRLTAPHTCAQLARFLATPGAHIDVPDISAPENPDCTLCRGHTTWHARNDSAYYACTTGCKLIIYPSQVAR